MRIDHGYNKGILLPPSLIKIKHEPLVSERDIRAMGFGHGGSPSGAAALPPPIAAKYGFNTNTFFDGFDNINTIDTNNTLLAGKKWYVAGCQGATQDAADFSISNSILTFTPKAGVGGWIATTGYIGNSPSSTVVGTPIAQTGLFFEGSMAFSTNNSGGSTSGPWWPTFWIDSVQRELNLNTGFTSNFPMIEMDVMEYDAGALLATVHHWATNTLTSHHQNTNNTLSQAGINFSNQNKFQFAWVPVAKNGGTVGKFEWYINNILMASVTYSASIVSPQADGGSPTGVFNCCETASPGGLQLMLGSGAGWPVYVDYVTLWQ